MIPNLVFQLGSLPDKFGYWFRFGQYGGRKVALVEWVDHEPGTVLPPNCGFEVDRDDLQALVDVLWDSGFRPSKMVSGVSPELHSALKNHLDDLRYLAVGSKTNAG